MTFQELKENLNSLYVVELPEDLHLGDIFWVMYDNKPTEVKVCRINVTITLYESTITIGLVRSNSAKRTTVDYNEDITPNNKLPDSFYKKFFRSKKELINSL